jgi:TfoX/Sxy family transcriptional regulator of competence genes
MAYNQELTERVRALLIDVPHVTEKKMFGSIGFMVNGKLCLGVGDHQDHNMMVRVGIDAYADALKRDGAAPAIMRGREQPGYIFLVSEAVDTPEDLRYWVDLALDYNKTL